MSKKSSLLIIAAAATLMVGCESKAGTGALVGAGLGVGAGALIGGGGGAVVGGAVGAIGGGLVGAALDAQDRKNVEEQNPRTLRRVDRGEQLSVNDIIDLHKANISDDKIISLIDKTNSTYMLNTYQIDNLRKAGVSNRVINYMINT